MAKSNKNIIRILVVLFFFVMSTITTVFAQTPSTVDSQTPTPSPTPENAQDNSDQITQLNNKIQELQGKIDNLHTQEDSLSAQISVMDNQIQLTEYRMSATQQQITQVTTDIQSASKRMKNLEGSLTDVSKVLLNRIVATYETGSVSDLQVLLASQDVSDFMSKLNYLKLVQGHDKQLLYNTQQAKLDYANQKLILEDRKKKIEVLKTQLEGYSKQLDDEKQGKQSLLSSTQNDESKYQSMLADAKAQINAFKSFATAQGGSILPPQDSPDGWYYNQRDSRWGNNRIGSSSEPVWEVGCLLTSMAMVMKKHGVSVTPADVAANGSYFFSNTAYMALPWGGGKFYSAWQYNQSAIDSKLASGEPVIVGVRNGAHFIVLKSGSGGNYIINDPWYGANLNFSDYYSTSSISQYGWYNG